MSNDKNLRDGAIDDMIAANLSPLTAFVRLRMGPLIPAHESCEDIVQSTCREALNHADRFRFDGDGRFRQWLFTTALRKLVDRKRYYLAEKRRVDRNVRKDEAATGSEHDLANCYQSAFASPSDAAMKREDIERLERAFDRLNERDREVVSLSRLAGLSHDQIAKQIGVTAGTVRVRLSRAMARLAALMTPPASR